MRKNNVQILDEKGIAGMRKVCRLSREVLDIAAAAAKPGVTTDYIDEIVHNACIERKVRGLAFFVVAFADESTRLTLHR